MAISTSWLVKRNIYAKTRADSALVFYLLITMFSMFAGAVIYLRSPSVTSIVEAVGLNAILMTGGIIFILRYWAEDLLEDEQTQRAVISGSENQQSKIIAEHDQLEQKGSATLTRRTVTISLILLNEFMMGWAFVLASGTSLIPSGSAALSAFETVVGSEWFIFTMALEMLLSVYFLRNDLPRNFVIIILLQSVVMFFAPTAIRSSSWASDSIILGSVAMVGLLIFVYEFLFKHRMITSVIRWYLLALISMYALMMAGLYVWEVENSVLLFVISVIGEMAVFFDAVLSGKGVESSKSRSWLNDPWWVFGFMSMTFIAEYFMGGLFDILYHGQSFVTGISFAPIAGSIANQAGAAFYDFISYFGAITGSSWFLIMMGAEMGALVVFKITITRELETKIRLGLVILAYFTYSIFLPSFVFGTKVASIPFLGWSMGIGTAGAVAPVFLAAILGTYLITGVLSFLFGARQTCSVFCTAALMYQGTFPDSMKEFNRTSKLGRSLLTSRMSGLYKVVASLVITSVIVAAIVSYLNSVGVISFTFFGSDIASFLYILYFDFLWYIIFVSIPFVGTYGCVSTGMCHWGLFNQFVSRFGMFRLKVKDPMRCATCETKDCAKACPVGLTDLPGSFISSGQYRSHKCIGVGDCVSACPYENEYFYDVRGWLRQKLGKPTYSGGLTNLPVIGNATKPARSMKPAQGDVSAL